ncbi:MAG: hypothetical protein ACJ8R9_05490 [Steroidobacteraceae bacterium]
MSDEQTLASATVLGSAPASEVRADPGAASGQPRRREPRTVIPRAIPVSKCKITLHTEYAQRVYYRTWDRLKADLYVLTVRTRAADKDEAAAAIETVITEAFDKARTDLASDLERTEVLRDQVKVTDVPDYEDRLETVATFSTPRAREFLALIQQTDQLLMLYDALWLAGFAKTHDVVHRSQNWQRRLIKITNRLRELANRTRITLARQSARPTLQPAAVSASPEPAAALESESAVMDAGHEGSPQESEYDGAVLGEQDDAQGPRDAQGEGIAEDPDALVDMVGETRGEADPATNLAAASDVGPIGFSTRVSRARIAGAG